MARPKKNNAEYFAHDADMRNDVKIKALRRKFSHTGYAVWNYLLETLTDSDFFKVEWEDISIELLAADYDVSVSELNDIVEYCTKIGLLQKDGDTLYSAAHQKRFTPLLANRERKRVADGNNPVETPEKGVPASHNPAKPKDSEPNGDAEPHSKGKESKGEENKEKYPYQAIADLWNSLCPTFPQVLKLSQARKDKIRTRLEEFGAPDKWIEMLTLLFTKVEASKFLRGESTEWRATFDWLFENSKNWVKVFEGNYDNKGEQQQVGHTTLGYDERIENGRRTYGTGKATIPMDAPPRPSERYSWNSSTQSWIMQ